MTAAHDLPTRRIGGTTNQTEGGLTTNKTDPVDLLEDTRSDEAEVWIEDDDGSLAPTGEFTRDRERPSRLIRRMTRTGLIGDTPGWRWNMTLEAALDGTERRAVLRQEREPRKRGTCR